MSRWCVRARLFVAVAAVSGLLVSLPSAAWAAPVDVVPPGSITVCRSGGAVQTVPFAEYVREVLAKEFPGDWPVETLKAGAVAVKSYAWYHVEHPYRPGVCHLTDGTEHQLYAPEDPTPPRTPRTDGAVEASWTMRIEEVREGRAVPLYAQYCSNCTNFPPGQHLNQWEAREQGAAGWSFLRILEQAYRNKPGYRSLDWRHGLGIGFAGESPHHPEPGGSFVMRAPVVGVPAGHGGSAGHLLVDCTIDGRRAVHLLQTVRIASGPDGPEARFDGADRMKSCAERDFIAIARLTVNGYLVGEDADPARAT